MWKLTLPLVTSCRCLTSSVQLTLVPSHSRGMSLLLPALSSAGVKVSTHHSHHQRWYKRQKEEATYSSGQNLSLLRRNYLLTCKMSKFGTGLTENQVKFAQSITKLFFKVPSPHTPFHTLQQVVLACVCHGHQPSCKATAFPCSSCTRFVVAHTLNRNHGQR